MGSDRLALFVIGAMQTRICLDAGEAAESFAQHRALVCNGVLDPPFLATLQKICGRAQFTSDEVEGVGHREIEVPPRAGGALTLALKRANLLRWIQDVTRCGPIRSVEGRVVQTHPNAQDQLLWHNDLNDPRRRLAITIHLGVQPYEGGMFELRVAKTGEILLRHRHLEPGSALILDVARGLEHRLLPVTSGGPRRVYAGWFLESAET